ncbi:sulfite exporter TauE/SafE family protein [Ferruginibacter sp.]
MIQLLTAAMAMGLLGSFHCIGMCGPLALSLPLRSDSYSAKFFGAFLYNSGRVVTYTVLGLLLGTIGKTAGLLGVQQWLSVVLGVVIIVFIVLPKKTSFFKKNNYVQQFFANIRHQLGQLFLKQHYSSLFATGLLNGLLPCGLVYMAAAVAVATGGLLQSALFMAFFGLGTLPLMWALAFFGNFISIGIRQKIRKAYPLLMLLMACLLIIRGMGLGITYISPKMNNEKVMMQNCYAVPGTINKK